MWFAHIADTVMDARQRLFEKCAHQLPKHFFRVTCRQQQQAHATLQNQLMVPQAGSAPVPQNGTPGQSLNSPGAGGSAPQEHWIPNSSRQAGQNRQSQGTHAPPQQPAQLSAPPQAQAGAAHSPAIMRHATPNPSPGSNGHSDARILLAGPKAAPWRIPPMQGMVGDVLAQLQRSSRYSVIAFDVETTGAPPSAGFDDH